MTLALAILILLAVIALWVRESLFFRDIRARLKSTEARLQALENKLELRR